MGGTAGRRGGGAELGLSASDVELRVPLVETGVDSIMTVALRRALEKRTGLALPPTLLWEYPTAAAVIRSDRRTVCFGSEFGVLRSTPA